MTSSPLHSTAPDHALELRQALASNSFLVVGLCAAWCNTCAEFREGFETIAAAIPDSTFVWVDIEDDADVAGEIEVENFPTIAVFHRQRLLHFGVSLPQPGVVIRLLRSLTVASRTVSADAAVLGLPARLAGSPFHQS